MKWPIATHLAIRRPVALRVSAAGLRRRCAVIVNRTGEVMAFEDDVQNNFEILFVETVYCGLGVRKGFRIPGKLAVIGIPAVGAEAGAQVNHCVAWELLLAEHSRFGENFIRRPERSMRLLISERP